MGVISDIDIKEVITKYNSVCSVSPDMDYPELKKDISLIIGMAYSPWNKEKPIFYYIYTLIDDRTFDKKPYIIPFKNSDGYYEPMFIDSINPFEETPNKIVRNNIGFYNSGIYTHNQDFLFSINSLSQ